MQRNDLENIIPFFILGYMYAMTWYTPYWRARLHYRIFVGARLLHSFCHFFAIQVNIYYIQIILGSNLFILSLLSPSCCQFRVECTYS